MECLNFSLLEMPEYTPILAAGFSRASDSREGKGVEVVSFHDLAWEVTLYHFCLLLNFQTESLDPA